MIEEDWQSAIDREHELSDQIKAIGDTGNKRQRRGLVIAWWSHVSAMLRRLALSKGIASQEEDLTIPSEMLLRVSGLSAELARGWVPEPISDVAGVGRPMASVEEERHIAYATAYLTAVREGKIHDATATKTVAEMYCVSRQTAQAWAKKPLNAQMKGLIERDPALLVRQMKRAGEKYATFGRSSKAIRARAKL